jgi:hypothetical protein
MILSLTFEVEVEVEITETYSGHPGTRWDPPESPEVTWKILTSGQELIEKIDNEVDTRYSELLDAWIEEKEYWA